MPAIPARQAGPKSKGSEADGAADLRVAIDAVDDEDGVEHVDFHLDAAVDRNLVIGEREFLLVRRAFARLRIANVQLFVAADRKSVVSGRSMSVRVDLGGRRTLTHKINC